MVELVFVIVVLGILASVAIPRLAVTRDDAILVKGQSQVAAIRSGIAMQKATALLQGLNTAPYNSSFRLTKLDDAAGTGTGERLFNFGDGNTSNVLESYILSKDTATGGWMKTAAKVYTFEYLSGQTVTFTYDSTNGTFNCTGDTTTCNNLTQ